MVTLFLQVLVALLKLAFGALAARVAARVAAGDAEPASELRRSAWWVTGVTFLLSGAGSILQSSWAAGAVAAGAASGLYEAFIRWTPAMNYSRILLMLGYGLVILSLSALHPLSRSRGRGVVIFLLICFVVGGGAGWMEGGFQAGSHTTWLSVSEMAELIVLLAALGVALFARSLDWMLWTALLLYSIRQAINALFWAAASWSVVPEAWHPPFWSLQVVAIVGWVGMIALASMRLARVDRRQPVEAPLEPWFSSSLSTIR